MTGWKFSVILKNKNEVEKRLALIPKKPFSLQPVLNGTMVSWPSG